MKYWLIFLLVFLYLTRLKARQILSRIIKNISLYFKRRHLIIYNYFSCQNLCSSNSWTEEHNTDKYGEGRSSENDLIEFSLRNPKNFRTCEPFKFSNARFFFRIKQQNNFRTQSSFVRLLRRICNAKTLGFLRLNYGATIHHGSFTNGWETRSRDVWKPVSNRTPGIISKICKLAGGTPAPVRSGLLGPYKISHGLIWGK